VQRVVARTAHEPVLARLAAGRVVARAAADAVVAGSAEHAVVAREGQHAVVSAERVYHVGLRRPDEPVRPVVPLDRRRDRCRGERPGRRDRRD
jgi:hypothetical protein